MKMGPNAMTSVLVKKKNEKQNRTKQKNRDKDTQGENKHVTSEMQIGARQGLPVTTRSQERGITQILPRGSSRNLFCQQLHFRLVSSTTMREYISLV